MGYLGVRGLARKSKEARIFTTKTRRREEGIDALRAIYERAAATR
jgi:hypothetical protein